MEKQEANYLESINLQLNRIADALEILARPGHDYTPNYVKPIEEYRNFNWSSIQASIVRSDQDGPTHVQWNGQVYTRRSPSNKFEPAIWFSRASGKGEDGETEYAKLITFREIKEADPLPEKARGIVNRAPAQSQPEEKKPVKQVPTPTIHPPAKPAPVSYTDYLHNAKAKNITEEAALWIAKKCEVPPENDHSKPNSYLEYFYEAKHAGMKLSEAWAQLELNGFDPKKASSQFPPF